MKTGRAVGGAAEEARQEVGSRSGRCWKGLDAYSVWRWKLVHDLDGGGGGKGEVNDGFQASYLKRHVCHCLRRRDAAEVIHCSVIQLVSLEHLLCAGDATPVRKRVGIVAHADSWLPGRGAPFRWPCWIATWLKLDGHSLWSPHPVYPTPTHAHQLVGKKIQN